MAPEIKRTREALQGRVDFGLLLGGLNIQSTQPLSDAAFTRFYELWGRVTATTGQHFAHKFPQGFVYNSTKACAAVLAAGAVLDTAPFDYLDRLQAAFFLEGRDINDLAVQTEVALALGMDEKNFQAAFDTITQGDAVSDAFAEARGYGSNALPAVLTENEPGYRHLMAGGYVTMEFLVPEIELWVLQ